METKIYGNDTFSGNREKDNIQAINQKKLKTQNNDSDTTPPQPDQSPSESPTVFVGSDSEGEIEDPISDSDKIVLSTDELKAYISSAVQQESVVFSQKISQLQDSLREKDELIDTIKSQSEKEKEKLEAKVENERKQRDTISKVLNEFGYSATTPVDSVYISPPSNRGNSISPRDAFREWNRLLEDRAVTQATRIVNNRGEEFIQMDTRPLIRFMNKHGDALYDAMETQAKKEGLLKGRVSAYSSGGKDAPTSFNTLSPALKTYLSEFVRKEHDAQFILWQIPNRTFAVGIPPGQTVGVPRITNLTTGATASDWILDPSVTIINNSQSLNASEEAVIIREMGIGKAGGAMYPLYIPEFVMANSLLDLQRALQQKLGYNYQEFVDKSILEVLLSTTAVRYNNGGNVTDDVTDLTTGSSGQMSVAFLGSLYADMASQKIPTFPDGCYCLYVPPFALSQLNSNMQINYKFFDDKNTEILTNMLFKKTQNEEMMTGQVQGYVGKVSGFHIFSGNSFSVGASGTAGVQTETINTDSVVTRSSFAMGPDAIAWATSMPMQIRQSNDDDFGRMMKFIWKSHESGAVAIDVDPDIDPPDTSNQNLRVFEVRFTDVSI
jgi:hypothetical protein